MNLDPDLVLGLVALVLSFTMFFVPIIIAIIIAMKS